MSSRRSTWSLVPPQTRSSWTCLIQATKSGERKRSLFFREVAIATTWQFSFLVLRRAFLYYHRMPTADHLEIAQDTFFLGFPMGLHTEPGDAYNLTSALVKHAYFSGRVTCQTLYPKAKRDEFLDVLDGTNNHGFSGGPVLAPDASLPGKPLRLVGVISGFYVEQLPVAVKGVENPDFQARTNSGLIYMIPISRVMKLIRSRSR